MDSNFKVNFGRVGRSLIYEDDSGTLLFSFDFAEPDGKRIIIYKAELTSDLKPIPSVLLEDEQSRLQLAHERVKQYVVSRGYKLYEENAG
jgi:hypothetical protein